MTKLQEEYESVTPRLQGKPQTLYWHDYAKWLENKIETLVQQPLSDSDYLSSSPKLKKLQDILHDYKNDVYGHETFSVTKYELESFFNFR